jgi:hypothetical protein
MASYKRNKNWNLVLGEEEENKVPGNTFTPSESPYTVSYLKSGTPTTITVGGRSYEGASSPRPTPQQRVKPSSAQRAIGYAQDAKKIYDLGSSAYSAYAGSGATTAAGGANTAAATAAVGGGTLATAAALGGAAYGAYGLYKQWDSLDSASGKLKYKEGNEAAKGAAYGAMVGSAIPVVGTALGAVIGGVYGASAKKLKTGKSDDQLRRDVGREKLEKMNFIDNKGKFVLKDGSTFEMGQDGGFRYDDGMRAFEVDHNDTLQSTVFGNVLPLAEMISGGDEKLKSDMAGYLTRASISNTKDLNAALGNAKDMAERLGITPQAVDKYTNEGVANQTITEQEALAYKGGFTRLFSDRDIQAPTPQQQENDYQGYFKPSSVLQTSQGLGVDIARMKKEQDMRAIAEQERANLANMGSNYKALNTSGTSKKQVNSFSSIL